MAGNYEVVVGWTSPAGQFKNVLHYAVADESNAGWQEWANYVQSMFILHWQQYCVDTFGIESVYVREDIENGVGVTYVPAGAPVYGTSAEDEFMGQAAVLVNKRSNGPSRPVLGRAYLPGSALEYVTDQSAWANNVRDAAEAFLESLRLYSGPVEGIDMQMLIKAADPTRPNTSDYGIVTSIDAINAITTLRSRKRGVGA